MDKFDKYEIFQSADVFLFLSLLDTENQPD